MPDFIFVFGSNLAGRHGKGAALQARASFGAVPGKGRGRTGMAYAIPTKDENLTPRSLDDITTDFTIFCHYARENGQFLFLLTPIGCGLAGHKPTEIVRMIRRHAPLPRNIVLTSSWLDHFPGD